MTLEAIPTPDFAGWPPAQPIWDGAVQSTTIEIPVDVPSADSAGTSYTVVCCDTSVTVNVVVCEVGVIPIAVPGNAPDISPNMCLNAQASYKKARWRVVVKPPGTTANFHAFGHALGSASGVVDGQELEVVPNPGVGPGEYGVQVFHTDLDTCYATEDHHKVFQFEFEDVSIAPGPTTPATPADSESYKESSGTATAPRSFSLGIKINLITSYGPESITAFSQTATWQYRMVTTPPDAFIGRVECPTTIVTTIPSGESALLVTGIIAAQGVGASTAALEFTDEVTVSGLANGNGNVSRPFSVLAPTVVVFPVDSAVMDGSTVWNNPLALYDVGATVSAEGKMTMSGTRGGVAPLLTSAA